MDFTFQEYVESKKRWFDIMRNIQSHIFSLNEANFQETKEIFVRTNFQYSRDTTYNFLDLILIAMKSRPLNFDYYKQLLKDFSPYFQKYNYKIQTFLKMHFSGPNFFNEYQFDTKPSFNNLDIDDIEDHNLKVFKAICHDSVDDLQYIFSHYDIFINSLITANEIQKLINISFPQSELNIIDLAAYFGSVNIFKFLYLSKAEISNLTLTCAIFGGSLEIIKIIQSDKKFDFEFNQSHLNLSIKLHHDNLIEYITENSSSDLFSPEAMSLSIEYYNIDYFLSHCDRIINSIKTDDEDKFSSLLFDCLKFKHLALFAVLLHIPSIDVNHYHILFNNIEGTIIHAAARMDNISYMKFFLEIYRLDPNLLTRLSTTTFLQSSPYLYANGLSALHIAVLRKDPALVKLLLTSKFIDPNITTRDTLETPLHFACRNNYHEIIEILLNDRRTDVNKLRIPRNRLFDGKSPADISLTHRDFNSFSRIKRHGGKTSSYFLLLFLFHVLLFIFSVGHISACCMKKTRWNVYLTILEIGTIFRFLMTSFNDMLFDED